MAQIEISISVDQLDPRDPGTLQPLSFSSKQSLVTNRRVA